MDYKTLNSNYKKIVEENKKLKKEITYFKVY